jgi:hypothetical protein
MYIHILIKNIFALSGCKKPDNALYNINQILQCCYLKLNAFVALL